MGFFIGLFLWLWIGYLKFDHDATKIQSDKWLENRDRVIKEVCFSERDEANCRSDFERNQAQYTELVKDEIEYAFGIDAEVVMEFMSSNSRLVYPSVISLSFMVYQLYLAKEYGKIHRNYLQNVQRETIKELPYLEDEELEKTRIRFYSTIERNIKRNHPDLDLYMYMTQYKQKYPCNKIYWNFDMPEEPRFKREHIRITPEKEDD